MGTGKGIEGGRREGRANEGYREDGLEQSKTHVCCKMTPRSLLICTTNIN
jgi:hypothetical protein